MVNLLAIRRKCIANVYIRFTLEAFLGSSAMHLILAKIQILYTFEYIHNEADSHEFCLILT